MQIILLFLVVLYSVVPAIILSRTLKRIRATRDDAKAHLEAWLVDDFVTFLIAFSFLPLLFWGVVDLQVIPTSWWSVLAVVLAFIIAAATLPFAIKKDRLMFFIGGVQAAFFEEILFRGVIFGLLFALTQNLWTTLVINSVLFGLWHLKNIPWSGKKRAIPQAFYTGLVAGPVFCLLLIYTGDIYLSLLVHLLHNVVLTFSSKGKR